ncbi:MAG: hypothetical protein OHK0039_44300 [Bacteroidia bacterium]
MRTLCLCICLTWTLALQAQLADDFSDGNFSQNPPWTGETTLFQVNAAGELQSNGPAASDTIYLATPQTQVLGAEWRIDCRYAFPPSAGNRLRVYLAASQADLEGPLDGYFVAAGEDGSNDSYDLYRQDGNALVRIIDGPDGLAAGGIDARLLVRRDSLGTWTLLADPGTGYQLQGSVFDDTYTTSAWFGVWVRHSATRNTAYFFDNVYAGSPLVDTLPPVLEQVEVLGPTQLRATFSEPLTAATALDAANYSLAPGIGSPAALAFAAGSSAALILDLPSPLADGTWYTLTVGGITDTAGNPIAPPQTLDFLYDVPDVPVYGDVRLNELMPDPDPAVALPNAEYVELYNRSAKTFDLAGWTFRDASSSVSLPAHTLAPGGFVILVAQTQAALFSGYGPVLGLPSLPSLNNTGDQLGLRAPGGLLIDTLAYTTAWYGDPAKANGGFALEQIDPTDDQCPPASNWGASVSASGGTPGAPNSIFTPFPETTPPRRVSADVLAPDTVLLCFDEGMDPALLADPTRYNLAPDLGSPVEALPQYPDQTCVKLRFGAPLAAGTAYTLRVEGLSDCKGNVMPAADSVVVVRGVAPAAFDLVITEIMPKESPAIGLPEAEFVEVYNRSSRALRTGGLKLTDGSTTAVLGEAVLLPGEYAIVCDDDDAALWAAYGRVLPVASLPSLNNTGDSLLILSQFDEPIEYLFYSESWYGDPLLAAGGRSLERIDADLADCNLPANWRPSLAPAGGTPGSANSVAGLALGDVAPPRLLRWSTLLPDRLELVFDEPLAAADIADPGNYRIEPGAIRPEAVDVRYVWGIADRSSLLLDLPADLAPGIVYTLVATGLQDCQGNAWTDTLRVGLTRPAAAFELVFNELLGDPTPRIGLPEVEFVELHNPGSDWLGLGGCRLGDGGTGALFPAVAIEPGGYLVVCAASAAAGFAADLPVLGLAGFPSLGNDSDSLYLLSPTGEVLDYVFYDVSWYDDPAKQDGGWTLERVDAAFTDCNQPANWRAARDVSGGTPGRRNSVAGTWTDSEAPVLLSLAAPAENIVELTFSEPLDAAAATDPDRYVVGGFGGNILLIELDPGRTQVRLVFDQALDGAPFYPLDLDSLRDCSGNALTLATYIGLPQAPAPGDVLISEILYNPYTGGSDFVEIYNASDKFIDLQDLWIGEVWPGTDSIFNTDRLSEAGLLLAPRQYLCLTADVAYQRISYLPPADARFLELRSFPSYDDREGICVVFTTDSVRLDVFAYLDDYQHPSLADEDGVSLERISFGRPASEPDNWHSAASAVRYATPGYRNSQAGDATAAASEIELQPAVFSPDGDGSDDFLTIRYHMGFGGANARVQIFDTQGRLIRILRQNTLLGSDGGAMVWDGRDEKGTLADVGPYVVVFELTRADTGERQVFRRVAVLAQRI